MTPDEPIVYHNRGSAYLRKGQVKQAITDYNTVLSLSPDYAEAYYNRGMAWLHLCEFAKAKADLIAAQQAGVAIMAGFRDAYKSVVDFEQKIEHKLPEDISTLLTPEKGAVDLEKENRLALALKYYKNGEISMGLAAQLVGVSREAFMYLIGNYGLSPLGTAEALRSELENANETGYL